MNTHAINDIDFDDMDDLQISERFGWDELSDNEIIPDELKEPKDYDTEFHSLNFDQKDG